MLVPIIYVASGATSRFYDDYNVLFWVLTVLFGLTTLFRVISMKRAGNNKYLCRAVYFVSSVGIGVLLGVYAATSFYFYEDSWTNVIVLFILAAVTGACISSYSIWKRLNQWYIVFLTGPPTMRIVSGFCFIAFGYNLCQAVLWNKNF